MKNKLCNSYLQIHQKIVFHGNIFLHDILHLKKEIKTDFEIFLKVKFAIFKLFPFHYLYFMSYHIIIKISLKQNISIIFKRKYLTICVCFIIEKIHFFSET